MVAGDADKCLRHADGEGIRLTAGLVVIVAQDRHEVFGIDQIGQFPDNLAILDQYRRRQPDMVTMQAQGRFGQRPCRRIWPLIEPVGFATQGKVGLRFLAKRLAEVLPLQALRRQPEADGCQRNFRPGVDRGARVVPDVGDTAHEVARLGTKGATSPASLGIAERVRRRRHQARDPEGSTSWRTLPAHRKAACLLPRRASVGPRRCLDWRGRGRSRR